jgi:hypothetical protein
VVKLHAPQALVVEDLGQMREDLAVLREDQKLAPSVPLQLLVHVG